MSTFSEKMEKFTSLLTKFVLLLTPLFFLPITREFVIISKLYFFIYAVIVLALMSLVYLVVSKKIVWQKDIMINGLLLFLIACALSIVIMSPNKMGALFIPQYGFLGFLSLVLYYIFLMNATRKNSNSILFYTGVAGFIASLVSVVMFIQPFKGAKLPDGLAFLQSQYFNPVGSQLELLIFLGFVVATGAAYFMHRKEHGHTDKNKTMFYAFIAVALIGGGLQLFEVIKAVFVSKQGLILPPYSTSWYAALEILKNPFTALFGVGIGNFSAVFTQVKTQAYNATELWQISSFTVSRSALLHVITETGLIGLTGIGLVIYNVLKGWKRASLAAKIVMGYALVTFVLLPPSFILFFVFIVALAYYTVNMPRENESQYVADLGHIIPVYIATIVLYFVFIGGVIYFTSTAFMSELIFKKALDAVAKNDVRQLYDLQRKAIIVNPYNEDFRKSFSQTNMLIANNIAAQKPEQITDAQRQTITQAIQASIAEAKAAVALNPQKVSNWQYLASVYRSIINVAQGAELWTIASYQRAILLDPQNPVYRLELGGVYYLLKGYDDAQRLFEQSVSLKPDWANAHYNLAWTYYRKEDYQNATVQMQQVLNLIDQKKNAEDYKAAQKDLAEFKKKLPAAGESATGSADQTATQPGEAPQDNLLLPTPPTATFEPKLELPNASPEAGLNR